MPAEYSLRLGSVNPENAACCLGFADRRGVIDFDGQADEPAIRHTRHDGGLDLADEPDGLAHLHPPDDRQLDALAVYFNSIRMLLIRAGVGAEAVVGYALLLETRILRAASKEVLEGRTKILNSLLRRVLGDFRHPWKRFGFQRIQFTT
jgi:hypothetical protein